MDSDVQRRLALRRANNTRQARAEFKDQMRETARLGNGTGKLDAKRNAVEVLTTVPDYLSTARIGEFLTWIPGMGKAKATRICRKLKISQSDQLGDLIPSQRQAVAIELLPTAALAGGLPAMPTG